MSWSKFKRFMVLAGATVILIALFVGFCVFYASLLDASSMRM